MKERLASAFRHVCDGFSADRVVADPELNPRFIEACRQAGLTVSVRDLNIALLNLRKSGDLGSTVKVRRTEFRDQEEYRHASEIAARHMELKHGVSWDVIVSTPELVAEFDAEAASIAPGFDALRYRWAVFSLRKQRKLVPELLARVVSPVAVSMGAISALDVASIVAEQGIYLFHSPTATLYIGEAENLRKRIAKHLDHSDNKGLARWLWDQGIEGAHLELRILPPDTPTRVRRALEAELIRSRQPLFNIKLT
ncbi:MAG: GIY-YIG nuclease family protein [Planctomycetia bacterium]|nr:GIY-YIG nuclease family protein [Planctomycetia bacterium]